MPPHSIRSSSCTFVFLLVLMGIAAACPCSLRELISDRDENAAKPRRKLFIVSFDGFRWDYYDRYPTPNFHRLAEVGVHARFGIKPAFTTLTFPNHFTLATGLYEEHHGIVDNEMYDPEFDEFFNLGTLDPKWWNGGEPLWITATKQDVAAGVYCWAGGNVVFQGGLKPKYTVPYSRSLPFKARVDTSVQWLTQGADVVMTYFHEPDSSGHEGGAFSPMVEKAVKEADDTLGYLVNKLEANHLLNSTNLIVVSDHGMTNRSSPSDYIIDLSAFPELMERTELVVPFYGPVVGIMPKKNTPQEVKWFVEFLKNTGKKMKVYKKEDIPEEYHYKRHRRIMPIILIADEGYVIGETSYAVRPGVGFHGYDNRLHSMWPIFFARGPDFKEGHVFSDVVEGVDIYPLACKLLGIRPAEKTDGRLCRIAEKVLRKDDDAGSCERNQEASFA